MSATGAPPSDPARESFNARRRPLEIAIEAALSVGKSSGIVSEVIVALERELTRYTEAVDGDLARVRARRGGDSSEPHASLKREAQEMIARARRVLARVRLDCLGHRRTASEVFSDSTILLASGTRGDVARLRRAAQDHEYEFLSNHADALEERLTRHDPLAVRAPVPNESPPSSDAALCEIWFQQHREDLFEQYGDRFIAVTRDGVIAVGDTERKVDDRVYELQADLGPFWAYVANPSRTIQERAERAASGGDKR